MTAIAIQNQFTPEQTKMLRDTICKGATHEEFKLFTYVCSRTQLDPFMKQIYPVKRWDKKVGREVMTMQTSIDGYRLIAERTGKYSPGREPTFVYDENGNVVSATAYVKKMTADGTWHEIAATAFYSEYVQRNKDGKPTQFWQQMPHNQLSKCAEALCLRKAFPADLSGIYTQEEMSQADVEIVQPEPKQEEKKPMTDLVTKEQAQELLEILDSCDMDYQMKFWNRLKKGPLAINSLEELPVELYEKCLSATIKKRDEFKATQEEKVVEECPF